MKFGPAAARGDRWSRGLCLDGTALQRRPPFRDRMIEQLKDEAERGHVLLFDGAIMVALEGFRDDRVDFPLRSQQILLGSGIADLGDNRENAVAVAGVVIAFVPVQIAPEPGGGRADARKQKQCEPEVVAILV